MASLTAESLESMLSSPVTSFPFASYVIPFTGTESYFYPRMKVYQETQHVYMPM